MSPQEIAAQIVVKKAEAYDCIAQVQLWTRKTQEVEQQIQALHAQLPPPSASA